MVFVDTGAWFANFVPDDPHHQRIDDWLSANTEPLLTTDYCVDETLTLLMARRRLSRALVAGHFFFHKDVLQIHFVTPDQIRRAWILFQQRAAAGWSFTDCTSRIVMGDLGIQTAAAVDEHFRQFGNVPVLP
ncbi:MAG: type II toxin-antitoxin system VapC family toxin [Pirellulaceae bacterium]